MAAAVAGAAKAAERRSVPRGEEEEEEAANNTGPPFTDNLKKFHWTVFLFLFGSPLGVLIADRPVWAFVGVAHIHNLLTGAIPKHPRLY